MRFVPFSRRPERAIVDADLYRLVRAQLLASVFPSLKKLQKEEGEAGRRSSTSTSATVRWHSPWFKR